MPTTCQFRTRPLPLSPPVSANQPPPYRRRGGGLVVVSTRASIYKPSNPGKHLKQSSFLGSARSRRRRTASTHAAAATSSIFTQLREALTSYSQTIRSYLECVTGAILHHLTDQEPPPALLPGMSRYRFGWGGGHVVKESAVSQGGD